MVTPKTAVAQPPRYVSLSDRSLTLTSWNYIYFNVNFIPFHSLKEGKLEISMDKIEALQACFIIPNLIKLFPVDKLKSVIVGPPSGSQAQYEGGRGLSCHHLAAILAYYWGLLTRPHSGTRWSYPILTSFYNDIHNILRRILLGRR